MAHTLKVQKMGDALGLILPSSMLEKLNVREGDDLFVIHTSDGITLTPHDPHVAAAVEDARAFMQTFSNVFRELAS
ncbi:MAG: AbrB/MazE/SpoVT family DNA-binding domain-containing protein [Rhodothermales bacterium]